jgi:hypothetical protein
MDWEDVKQFLSRHTGLEEEKPGLYKFIEEADWRERYQVTLEEAEYLVTVELIGSSKENPLAWVYELEQYREKKNN